MNVSGGEHKVPCCKEQYYIGAWNVRSMNQGPNLDVVKQEMSRVNINILGISELKWTGMGEFNSDNHYVIIVGKNPLEEWSSPHSQQKSLKCSTWVKFQKWQNDLSSFSRQTIQHHSNPSFHHRGLECKSRKSRDTWSNRQVWSYSTKWNRAKANSFANTLVIANTHFQLPNRWLYTWTSPDGKYQNQIDNFL